MSVRVQRLLRSGLHGHVVRREGGAEDAADRALEVRSDDFPRGMRFYFSAAVMSDSEPSFGVSSNGRTRELRLRRAYDTGHVF